MYVQTQDNKDEEIVWSQQEWEMSSTKAASASFPTSSFLHQEIFLG